MSRRNFRFLLAGGLLACIGIAVAVAMAGGPLTNVDAYALENVQVGEIEGKLVDLLRGIAEDAGKTAHTPTNLLSPTAVDPNAFTPEFKGFLVKLERA